MSQKNVNLFHNWKTKKNIGYYNNKSEMVKSDREEYF